MITSENWPQRITEETFYSWQEEIEMPNKDMHRYLEMITWIDANIHNAENNVVWTWSRCPVFRFRKSKDQVWFMMRWS